MLDIKLVRERSDIIENDLKKRGDLEKIKLLQTLRKNDKAYLVALQKLEKLRHLKNTLGPEIARMKKEGKDAKFNLKEMKKASEEIGLLEGKTRKLKTKIDQVLYSLPNLLHESVPAGKSDADNKAIRHWGKKRTFHFKPRDHIDLLLLLDGVDLERAAKVAGARFYYLKQDIVLLEQALINFALETLRKKGFTLIETPFMMNRKHYEGVIAWGDFEDVLYKLEKEDLYLIATSEHPLVAKHAGETVLENNLPILYGGLSPCFRKEAGTHGRDDKGIFRVHHFNKVEQVVFCKPEESWVWFERLIKNSEEFFQALELPYQVVNVCTGDIGSLAAKKYDIEAWFPSQKRYREVVSCSNITDYQSRRLRMKYGLKDRPATGYVHTLNSTMVATQRALAAILENYQQEDGSVEIPRVLRNFMGGRKKIEPKKA